jgi:hypothetical protein
MMRSADKNCIFLFLLASAICLSPRFGAGTLSGGRSLDIRIEDILLIFLFAEWAFDFLLSKKTTFKKPPFFVPVLAWLATGFVSTGINIMTSSVEPLRGTLYFLKEAEFFAVFFYVFYHVKKPEHLPCALRGLILSGVVTALWVGTQLVFGIRGGEYLVGAVGEAGPFPSAGFFLILGVMLLSLGLFSGFYGRFFRYVLFATAVTLFAGVLGAMTKTAMLGLGLIIPVFAFLYLSRHGKLKAILKITVMILVLFVIFGAVSRSMFFRPITAGIFGEELAERKEIWSDQMEKAFANPFFLILGRGKSVFLRTEESHSGYVRNFVETGLIGSLIFFILMASVLAASFRCFRRGSADVCALCGGLFASTVTLLFLSIPADGFTVVRMNGLYWYIAGMCAAVIRGFKEGGYEKGAVA